MAEEGQKITFFYIKTITKMGKKMVKKEVPERGPFLVPLYQPLMLDQLANNRYWVISKVPVLELKSTNIGISLATTIPNFNAIA